jgi:hypothetical protein
MNEGLDVHSLASAGSQPKAAKFLSSASARDWAIVATLCCAPVAELQKARAIGFAKANWLYELVPALRLPGKGKALRAGAP